MGYDRIPPEMMCEFVTSYRLDKDLVNKTINSEIAYNCCKKFRELCKSLKTISPKGQMEYDIIFNRYLRKTKPMSVKEICKKLKISQKMHNDYRKVAITHIVVLLNMYENDCNSANTKGSNKEQ
jgi:hypothetical protein